MAQWTLYTEVFISNWVNTACTALFCYDYFLTLDREAQYVWTYKPKFSIANVLFYGFRYSALFNTILIVLTWAHPASWLNNSEHCTAVTLAQISFSFVLMCSSAVFSALRVYAITSRNIWLSLITGALALVYPATAGYSLIVLEPSYAAILSPGSQPCAVNVDSPGWSNWMIGSRASSVASDGFILIITWLYIRKPVVPDNDTESSSVTAVLMRDTILYFGALFIVNVLGIIIESVKAITDSVDILFATLTPLLTATILSRFMFDLRAVSSKGGSSHQSLSNSMFSTFAVAPPENQGEGDAMDSATDGMDSQREQWVNHGMNSADVEMLVIS